jgi:hypothetical protein
LAEVAVDLKAAIVERIHQIDEILEAAGTVQAAADARGVRMRAKPIAAHRPVAKLLDGLRRVVEAL